MYESNVCAQIIIFPRSNFKLLLNHFNFVFEVSLNLKQQKKLSIYRVLLWKFSFALELMMRRQAKNNTTMLLCTFIFI